MRRALLLALAVLPVRLTGQEIPQYVPANPLLESRSALYAQPYLQPANGWRIRWLTDYYNAVEVSPPPDGTNRQMLFDSEVLQSDLWINRDLSKRAFVFADVPLRGGYSGFLDAFLITYHKIVGLSVPARDQDPRNTFLWHFDLPDTSVTRSAPGTFLGDVRTGAGVRFGAIELIASATLPTATIKSDGWSRHVPGTSLAMTGELVRSSRVVLDAGASAGFTPTDGALARYQQSTFASGMLAARWRFLGQQSVFTTVWAQSPNWKNTGFSGFDDAEAVADFGFLLHIGRRAPELQLGITEDLIPRGPAMDVGFTIGFRWY